MLKQILDRIDRRLEKLQLTESAAAKKAGLSDSAIRDIRRAVASGSDRGVSSRTLFALAPVLKTTAAWLVEGTDCGAEDIDPENARLWRTYVALASAPDDLQNAILRYVEYELRSEGLLDGETATTPEA